MTWGMVAVAGASLVGGAMSASASKSAANTQAASADKATQLQKDMFDKQVELQEPWRQAGMSGLNKLTYLLGLSPNGTNGNSGSGTAAVGNAAATETADQIRARLAGSYTTNTPTSYTTRNDYSGASEDFMPLPIPGSSSVDNAGLDAAVQAELQRQNQASQQVGQQQQAAAQNDPAYGSLLKQFDPQTDPTYAGQFATLQRDFGMGDFQADPGYAFRMGEGQKALERSAAARGGLFSGRAMKDTLRFAQGLGSQEYGNAFNRFQVNQGNRRSNITDAFNRFNTNQTNQFNRLASVSGIGQTAANQLSNASQNYGQAVSNNIIGAGNAQAAGQVGAANAYNGAIGQGVSMYQQQNMLNRLMPQGGGGGSSYGQFGSSPMSSILYSNGSLGD